MKSKISLRVVRTLLATMISGMVVSCAGTDTSRPPPPTPRHTVGPPGLRMMPLYPPLPT
ncbi:MAG TPA: hypothetical protein VLE43_18835 [Candidatus Saccharimonadia bacterium]|nr:hypothetical protein [Candidatus Saccharimonadia bacterium]